jgi:hypothetical protein
MTGRKRKKKNSDGWNGCVAGGCMKQENEKLGEGKKINEKKQENVYLK